MDLKERKLKILEETVEYYSKKPQEKRCITTIDTVQKCFYDGARVGKKTKGCAVGRLLTRKQRVKIDNTFPEGVDVTTLSQNYPELLPKNIKNLGLSFLVSLQTFHDSNNFWNEEGITDKGLEYVKKIKSSIKASKS